MFGNKEFKKHVCKELLNLQMKISELERQSRTDRYLMSAMWEVLDEFAEIQILYPSMYTFKLDLNRAVEKGFHCLKIYDDGIQLWVKPKNTKDSVNDSRL